MKIKLLRYAADRGIVALTLLNVVAIMLVYVYDFTSVQIYLWAVFSLFIRLLVPLHQHNHGHLKTFRYAWMNNIYDVLICLNTGLTTSGWELQHNIGHHAWLLDNTKDVIAPERFRTQDGSLWSQIKFTFVGDITAYPDAIRIARQMKSKDKGRSLRRFFTQLGLQIAVIAFLMYLKPFETFWVVIVPALISRWAVFFIAYEQHIKCDLDSVYSACNDRPSHNFIMGLGYHTAHHELPTMHWSLLADRAREIYSLGLKKQHKSSLEM